MDVDHDTVSGHVEPSIKAVMFDLDGTLLDSFPVHYAAHKTMFERFGIELSKELFLRSYSPNWYRTYEAFGLAAEHWEAANAIWLEAAAEHSPELFPGVLEMLAALSKSFALGLVTSGSKTRVTSDMHRLEISSHFATVVTGDDVREPKPSPEGLEIALNELSISPNEAIYVGDAHADFEMATAAGVKFFGVPSEFANLTHGHPKYDIHRIDDLVDVIGRLHKVDGNKS